jgi:arginine decarboxylase
VSESGRAIVAHHSVLVVQAFGAIEKTPIEPLTVRATDHKLTREIVEIDQRLSEDTVNESWHDLVQIKEQAQTMFELGLLNLDVKARVETLFWQTAEKIQHIIQTMDPAEVPEDVKTLKIELSDQHICNFSVFQSLLDHWALGQLFPIVPIHRLNERPFLESTLVDITCDSDGKVSKYIDREDVRETLPLHEIRNGEPYYLGIFLTGAYQDIMGDIHNLFGRVNEVHVFLDPDEESGFYIEEEIPGQTIGEVLAMTQYDWRDIEKRMKTQIDAAIKEDRVKPSEGMRLLQDFERGLKDQTYLSLEG